MGFPKTTLFVKGISAITTAEDIALEFKKCGDLVRCDIPFCRGISKCYAFVEFVSETDAEKALTTLNNLCIDGSNIKIERARYITSQPIPTVRRKEIYPIKPHQSPVALSPHRESRYSRSPSPPHHGRRYYSPSPSPPRRRFSPDRRRMSPPYPYHRRDRYRRDDRSRSPRRRYHREYV